MSVRLLGLDFADLDVPGAAAWIAARGGESFGYVVTPNADHLVRLHRRPGLASAYAGAALRVLDSRVVARIGSCLGLTMPRVCPGSDLAALILGEHVRPDERITIIGLRPAQVTVLAARFGLRDPVHLDPPMGFWRDPAALAEVARFVRAHPARLIFLAVGSPGQEILAHTIARMGGARGIALCIGGALNFLTGASRRAPGWMQRAGLEWLHRLASEPRRLWRRYLLDSPRVLGLLWRARGVSR